MQLIRSLYIYLILYGCCIQYITLNLGTVSIQKTGRFERRPPSFAGLSRNTQTSFNNNSYKQFAAPVLSLDRWCQTHLMNARCALFNECINMR